MCRRGQNHRIGKRLPASLLEALGTLEQFDWKELEKEQATVTYAKIKRQKMKELSDVERMTPLIHHF